MIRSVFYWLSIFYNEIFVVVGVNTLTMIYLPPEKSIPHNCMNVKFNILFFVLLLSGFAAYSQSLSISGKVINGKKQPLTGATVAILNTNKATATDENGVFTFTKVAPGKYDISITATGYASVIREILLAENKAAETFQLDETITSLDDVVVTAEKKEQSVQKVPGSITALGARQVQDYRLWNNKELTAIVPNLYSADPGDARDVVAVRGIATTSYDPAVATYIDGVSQFGLDTYIPALFDVERIEVLRGPQGTLYGRNAMGGIINIISKTPGDKLDAFAELSVGNYGQQRITAGVRTPLVKNKLYLGVAGLFDRRNGYYTNEFNNKSYDKQHSFTGNYYLKYMPADKWQIGLDVKHRNNRNNGAFPLVFGVEDALSNPFKLNQNALTTMNDNTLNASLSVNYAGNGFGFSSQTAYQNNYRFYDRPIDGDFSPIDAISVINNYGKDWNNIKVFTQDIKFTSPAASSSPLKWTTGAFFFHQNAPVKQGTYYGNDANMMGVGDSLFTTINTTKSEKWGIAFYGQATYAITKKFNITAGLRYDYEHQNQSVLGEYQHDQMPSPIVITPDTSGMVSFKAISPKLVLDYELAKNSTLYALYSRGFRTGGLSQLSSDPSQPPLVGFKPEYSNNFEAGVKNTFLQNRLRVNVAVFYSRINDAQVPTLVLPDAITVTRNTGKLESKGVEATISAMPVKGLSLDYNFGYTHARFQELKISQNGDAVDLKGKRQLFTPDVTSMLAAQYSYPFGHNQQFQAIVRGEWKYIGTTYFDLSNSISQSGYSLFNAKAGVATKNVKLMFWARNIADKRYISYAYDFGAVHLGDPGVYGATLSFNLR
jgi:iron complex outermembrane receptor protein